jgi:predicted RNA methylase
MSPNTRVGRVMTGNTRVTGKEQYYTPPMLAGELTDRLVKLVDATDLGFANRVILEPAGGTGAFIDAAKSAGAARVVSFDIEPLHADVASGDFLEQELGPVFGAVTLGNPPFGRNNALSIPFFNKAAPHSDYIAFIVPRSWRKWTVINRLDQHFHLVSDQDLQIDYVDAGGERLMVKRRLNTCFQIWERRDVLRPKYSVEDLGFVSKVSPAEADVSLTIFGYNCGSVKTEFERRPNTTQMFLKLNHPDALPALRKVDFSRFFRHTAYTEALSLSEINYLINEAITGNPHLLEEV